MNDAPSPNKTRASPDVYHGPLIPLVAWSGEQDCLAACYARHAKPPAVLGETRPEIAGLMDMGLYGAGLAALTTFEASDLPRPSLAIYQRLVRGRPGVRLGVTAPSDLQVTEDRSADLGLLLTLIGLAAGRDLSHVVATGSLRTGHVGGGGLHRASVGPVGAMRRKIGLLIDLIETTSESRLTFLYPAEAESPAESEDESKTMLAEAAGHAAARGIVLDARPLRTVGEAMDLLGLSRRPYKTADWVLLAGLLAIALGGSAWLALDHFLSRPVPIAWAPPPASTGTTASTPLRVQDGGGGKKRYCLLDKGADQIPIVGVGEVLHFRARVESASVLEFAIIEALEERGVRVRPLPGWAEQSEAARAALAAGEDHYHIDFGPAVEAHAEYTRVMLIARRWPAIDLTAVEKQVRGVYDAATKGGGASAVANLLEAEFPGYLQYGFRSVEEDVTCTPPARS